MGKLSKSKGISNIYQHQKMFFNIIMLIYALTKNYVQKWRMACYMNHSSEASWRQSINRMLTRPTSKSGAMQQTALNIYLFKVTVQQFGVYNTHRTKLTSPTRHHWIITEARL